MIITKTGRRMFPGIKVNISGMEAHENYVVILDFANVDEKRYKFSDGEWKLGGRCEPNHPKRFFIHPDSPNTGSHWQQKTVSIIIIYSKAHSLPWFPILLNHILDFISWRETHQQSGQRTKHDRPEFNAQISPSCAYHQSKFSRRHFFISFFDVRLSKHFLYRRYSLSKQCSYKT